MDRSDAAILRCRAQVTARCPTMSGLETWTTFGLNCFEIAPDAGRKRERQPVFGPAWDRHRGHADEIAGRREGRLLDRRRIDADLHALAQQIADQPVERLVGAVADIIVIAREEGDAEVGRLHARGAVGVNW